jgi:ATP/maltotriose-dependent transcriptional regulator MalT
MAALRSLSFRGRARERQALDALLDQVRGGESAVLVIRGEAGIGKTALMRYCARQASGCQLAQVHGVESEMELPLAALHQRARDGQPNTEIAAELFLSTRTVEWHLRKVFAKFGISSRRQLREALPDVEHPVLPP